MHRQSNRYTFMFAFVICIVCSLALSIVSEGLRERKEINIALDIKKNILKAVNLKTPLPAKAKPQEVLDIYDEKIEEKVVDDKGAVVEGKAPEDMQEGYGFTPLTPEVKRKVFGENLARLLGIEPKRRVKV